MPTMIRGGGGGKNTKDATAVPADVRSGKIFYGADGKQTGIWTPKVTDYTGDATAVPGDVMKGEVFYNSKGRQTGTLEGLPIKYIGDITIIGGKEPVDYIRPWSGLATLYADADTELAKFESLWGGSSEAPSYSSGRDGFLKIPIEQINKVFLVYENINKIPIYLKEEKISVALVVRTGNSWIQKIRFDFDYETKELSWVIYQKDGQFGPNYQYRVYVY